MSMLLEGQANEQETISFLFEETLLNVIFERDALLGRGFRLESLQDGMLTLAWTEHEDLLPHASGASQFLVEAQL